MKPIKFIKNCEVRGEIFEKGDNFKVDKNNIDLLWKLNEKGFIEPLTLKEYKQIKEESNKDFFVREKEEKINGKII